ncbi:MAG: hypothetical protein R3F14_01875 [Polyangiaceae bacterium]
MNLDVQETRFDPENARHAVRYHYKLQPNTLGSSFTVEAPGASNTFGTYDTHHPAVAHLHPSSFGPYKLMTWDHSPSATAPAAVAASAVRQSYFRLDPAPSPWRARGTAGKRARWTACLSSPHYPPESYDWDNSYRTNSSASPGFKAVPLKTNQVDRRRRYFRQHVVDGATQNSRENIVEDICRVNNGNQPRSANLALDETLGGHTIHNHVLGAGTGVQDARDIALRAAFEVAPGPPTPLATTGAGPHRRAGLDGGREASGFVSQAAADRAAARAQRYMTSVWVNNLRDWFSRTYDSRRFHIRVPTADVIAYRRRRARRYTERDMPAYVPYGDRRATPGRGRRPLFEADRGSSGASARTRPLTDPVSLSGNVLVVVKATTTVGSNGWYILTMYPDS